VSDNGNGGKMFVRSVTLGNLLTMGTIVVAVVLAWGRLENHVADKQIHQPVRELQDITREQISLYSRPLEMQIEEMNRRLERIETILDSRYGTRREPRRDEE